MSPDFCLQPQRRSAGLITGNPIVGNQFQKSIEPLFKFGGSRTSPIHALLQPIIASKAQNSPDQNQPKRPEAKQNILSRHYSVSLSASSI